MIAILLAPVYLLANYYLLRRVMGWVKAWFPFFRTARHWALPVAVQAFLACSIVIAFFLPEGRARRVMKLIGNYWLGVLLYVLLAVIAADLLRLLLGLEQPDRGEITGVPHRCAAVFQEDRLIPGLSAVSNVTMAAGCSREAAAALLTELGVETDSQTKPTALLSGGQARRTALARALLAPGDLLILDEWGYVPVDKDGSQLLFRVISDSYESKSLILTTNLEFSKWGGIFTDDQMAAAMIDSKRLDLG